MYFIVAFLWTVFAGKKQKQLSDSLFKLLLCIVLNFIFCPIAILIAIFRKDSQ
jgi:hypothetical protein